MPLETPVTTTDFMFCPFAPRCSKAKPASSGATPMPTAQIGALELYYERAGSGPPLLFISGTGSDLRNKPNVFDGPLAKSFDVLGYDQRGLGRSSKPDVDYTMADYADDAAALLDALGWASAKV